MGFPVVRVVQVPELAWLTWSWESTWQGKEAIVDSAQPLVMGVLGGLHHRGWHVMATRRSPTLLRAEIVGR